MEKYNWTIDTLSNKLNVIKNLLKNEKNPERRKLLHEDYYSILCFLDDCNEIEIDETTSLLSNYRYIKNLIKQIEYLWDDFYTFSTITDDYIDIPELKKCSLSKDDILSITHDFYKSLNPFFFHNFMKNFSKRKDHIVFKNYNYDDIDGISLIFPGLQESFIEIYRNYTLLDILTTIHEYSHATAASINPNQLAEEKTLYSEIESIFFELISTDFIGSIFGDDNSSHLKIIRFNDFYDYSDDLNTTISLIEHEPNTHIGYKNNKQLKQIAAKELNISQQKINAIIGEPDLSSATYLISFMFALELYELYKKDKDKALYYLKKIILLENLSEKEYYNTIKRFGFIPNSSSQEYFNKLKIEALKLARKK